MQQGWRVAQWIMNHRHGTFFVGANVDGTANAARVYGESPLKPIVEGIGEGHENVASAMIACEKRIEELDLERSKLQAELLSFAERVA
jgi:hypothetical protein